MKSLALIALLASCTSQAGDDDYPIQPGSNPAPTSTTDTGQVTGQVCVVSDARDLGTCDPGAGAGLTVTAGAQTITTDANGGFSIPAASDGGLPSTVTVTGAGLVPTSIATSADSIRGIPVLRAELFSQMLAANGVTLAPGSGSILGSVARGGSPATGVMVTSTPSPAFGPLFDGTTPTAWTLDGTGARGVVWIPGVAAGPTNLTFRDLATSGETSVDGVQVINGGITIMDAILP